MYYNLTQALNEIGSMLSQSGLVKNPVSLLFYVLKSGNSINNKIMARHHLIQLT
jgi:hypothetical protein